MLYQTMRTRTSILQRSLKRWSLKYSRFFAVSTMGDELILERKGQAAVITLNRPKALNALNLNMIHKLYPSFKEWEDDPTVGVIIMKGAGEKAFCAGGDVRAIADAGQKGDPLTKVFFKEEYKLNYRIGTLKTPFIALIDGVTMGGGVGLSVHGHHRIATERTLFAMPETAIGFFPDVGGGYFLPRLRKGLGTFLALTGFRLKGRDTCHAGIATHFVDSSKIGHLEDTLTSLEEPNHEAVRDVLSKFHNESSAGHEDVFSLHQYLETIERHFCHSSLEAITESMKTDQSEWVQKQLKVYLGSAWKWRVSCLSVPHFDYLNWRQHPLTLLPSILRMSPVSLKVSLQLMLEGAKVDLREDLEMEYRLSQRFMSDPDFYEGIRAVLVDRDNQPKWIPGRIEDVSQQKVDSYFAPLPEEVELRL